MSQDRPGLVTALGRNPVLVGLPGAGKSSVGKRLAARLGVPFVDADTEIEKAAGMTIDEIFKMHGEPAFRDGEARVIARLVTGGPQVIATGGGAFMRADTREAIARDGIAIWLDASTDVLLSRIVRRTNRPLFHNVDPRQKLVDLRAVRDPVFAEAPIRVTSSAGPHDRVVNAIIRELKARVDGMPQGDAGETDCKASGMAEPQVADQA
nr:shikimate kinase [Acuticoccus sediminis]